MTTAETYVTAAFLVVLAVVLLWLVIYAFKMRRLESEVRELEQSAPAPDSETVGAPRVVSTGNKTESQPGSRTAEPVR